VRICPRAPAGGQRSCDDAGVHRVLPGRFIEMTDDDIAVAYEYPASIPWVRGSMVMSLDGTTTGPDGSSRSIASPVDRRLFSKLRLRADVVLVGAGTLRDERYPPSLLPIAIVTESLRLRRDLPVFAERQPRSPRTLVYTTAGAAAAAPAWLHEHADINGCGESRVDLRQVVAELTDRSLGHVHCEGGPRLLSSLLAADLVDELLVTVSPVIVGATGDQHLADVLGGLESRWRFTDVFAEDGTVFLRARRS